MHQHYWIAICTTYSLILRKENDAKTTSLRTPEQTSICSCVHHFQSEAILDKDSHISLPPYHHCSTTAALERKALQCCVHWAGGNGWMDGWLPYLDGENDSTKLSVARRLRRSLPSYSLPWIETRSCNMLELGVQDSVPLPLQVPRSETHTLPSS